jgi:transcriptional regulator with PAS, ATPase and Fis domain
MTIDQVKQRFQIIGTSRDVNNGVEIAMQVAPTEVTVLITGENGSGKDVFSKIIHQFSKRKHETFIAINCGAIPEGTLASELFGHEKGAFTGAYEGRKGYFEEANGGTIFLDEIAEMPLDTQSQLLRLLENGEYLRVGSSKVRKTDVRVIAATNKNLVDLIRQGKFREDLYFRLNTVTIKVPPLRARGSDIELLFNYFAMEFSDKYRREPIMLTEDAVPLLYKYRWPGNIREIRNLVEKLSVLIKGDIITPEVLQENLMIKESYLPSLVRNEGGYSQEQPSRTEFDQLQAMFYSFGKEFTEMKKEIAELKKIIYMGIRGRDTAESDFPVRDEFVPRREAIFHDPYESDFEKPFSDQPEILPPELAPEKTFRAPRTIHDVTPVIEESLSLEKAEKSLIQRALTKYNGNRSKAASELGISERTLYRKIKNYDLA